MCTASLSVLALSVTYYNQIIIQLHANFCRFPGLLSQCGCGRSIDRSINVDRSTLATISFLNCKMDVDRRAYQLCYDEESELCHDEESELCYDETPVNVTHVKARKTEKTDPTASRTIDPSNYSKTSI
jgi:hydroxyacyl-ACP dehydratase HTD2-like protein with hotdog domain